MVNGGWAVAKTIRLVWKALLARLKQQVVYSDGQGTRDVLGFYMPNIMGRLTLLRNITPMCSSVPPQAEGRAAARPGLSWLVDRAQRRPERPRLSKEEEGYLRAVRFDAVSHVLLQEELKVGAGPGCVSTGGFRVRLFGPLRGGDGRG